MTGPTTTIGITCYNAQETISRAMLSALTQEGNNYEILVVDDSSTDRSLEILAEWKREFPTLRVVEHLSNKGVGAARNTLLEHARGEYVAFFDDDDVSAPHRLRRQIAAIEECERSDPAVPAVICNTARMLWKGGGRVDYEPTIAHQREGWATSQQMLDLIFLGRPVDGRVGACPTCSQAARTDVYREIGGFDESLRRGEDTEINIRLAKAGAVFRGLREPLVHQSVTVGPEKSIKCEEEAALLWVRKHRKYLQERNLYGFVDGWFCLKYDLAQRRYIAAVRNIGRLALRYPRLFVRRINDYRCVAGSRCNYFPDR